MTHTEDRPNMNDPEEKIETSGASATASPVGQPDDLHDLFAVPEDDAEDPLAGLRDDPNYAALIKDLEYIAREARLLFEPTEDPSDAVWDKIQSKLNTDSTD
jgi:hypothetical protein